MVSAVSLNPFLLTSGSAIDVRASSFGHSLTLREGKSRLMSIGSEVRLRGADFKARLQSLGHIGFFVLWLIILIVNNSV